MKKKGLIRPVALMLFLTMLLTSVGILPKREVRAVEPETTTSSVEANSEETTTPPVDESSREMSPEEEINILKNPGMEDVKADGMPAYWQTYQFDGSNAHFNIDENVAHSGKRSGKISAETTSRALYKQNITLEPVPFERKFRITQWVKILPELSIHVSKPTFRTLKMQTPIKS